MASLNIHLETFDNKSFATIEKLAARSPIAISVVPRQIENLPRNQITKLKEILSREGNFLGQQGLSHKCILCSSHHFADVEGEVKKHGVDPWHENYCLWFGNIPITTQRQFMQEGKEILEKIFGIIPRLYAPPNHLLDSSTIRTAADLGYTWITDRALIPLNPYGKNKIIVVPEGEPEIGCPQVYIHADRWRGDLEKALGQGTKSLARLEKFPPTKEKLEKNRMLKYVGKIARDFQKGFSMPEESSRKAAELIYESHFVDKFIL